MPDQPLIELDFRALLEAAPDGIAVVASDGLILVVNDQMCSLTGYRVDELVGRSVETLVPATLREKHIANRSGYKAHPSRRPMGVGLDLVVQRKDGRECPVEISLSPVDTGSQMLTIAVVRDISERQLLQTEREELRSALDTERERHRIGMDLHDGVMQDIYAVSLGLELVGEDINADPATAGEEVDRAIGQLHNVIRDIRSFIFDLRPREFAGDLGRALLDLASEFQENSGIRTEVDLAPALPEIDHEVALALYIITHEALSNTRKHARAGSVRIRLQPLDGALCLQVSDDGQGFDTSTQAGEGHRGLRNIANRAAALGARLEIISARGEGTTIEVAVPPD